MTRFRRTLLARVGVLTATLLVSAALVMVGGQPALAGTGSNVLSATTLMGSGPQMPMGLGVDEFTGSVYAANYSNGSVDVLDEDTNALTDVIHLSRGALGIAVDQFEGLVFVTEPDNDAVAVIDDSTDDVLSEVMVGDQPSGVAVDENTGLVFVANYGTDTVSVIDESTGSVTHTITVGTAPAGVAVDETTGEVFVTNSQGVSVSVIDESTLTVSATIHVLADPTAVAVDEDTGTVFVANDDQGEVSVIDEATNLIVHTTAELGGEGGTSDGLTVDEATGEVFLVTDAGAVLWPIDASTYDMGSAIDCGPSAGGDVYGTAVAGVIVDESTNIVYCANQQAGTVSAITEPVSITSDDPVDTLTANESYSTTFTARGPAPVTFAASDGTLPPGLTLDSTSGVLSGVPTTTGTFDYAITATDSDSDTVTQWYEQTVDPQIDRVSGSDRYATSVAVAAEEYPNPVDTVFVVSGTNYPDALSAGPVAAEKGAPVLLTDGDSLPSVVATEISHLSPTHIVLVGGTGVISTTVENQLTALEPSAQIIRIAGNDRYETSRDVVAHYFTNASTIYVATGSDFPDALTAGGAAGSHGDPLLLVDGSESVLDAATASLLQSLHVSSIKIVGGTGVVSAGLATSLASYGTVTRLFGEDRYATANAVNTDAYATANHVLLATGEGFPDALSATPWAGNTGSPLFLSTGSCIPQQTVTDIANLGVARITLIGGTGVLSDSVESLSACGSEVGSRAAMFTADSAMASIAPKRGASVFFGWAPASAGMKRH